MITGRGKKVVLCRCGCPADVVVEVEEMEKREFFGAVDVVEGARVVEERVEEEEEDEGGAVERDEV